jgi:hypothetical protein
MDDGQVSPLVVTVIVMVALCFVGGVIYVAEDQYKLRMYAIKHPPPPPPPPPPPTYSNI